MLNVTVNVAGGLAFTGNSSHTSTLVLAGIAALVLGLVFVVGSRRRRTSGLGAGPPAT
ncbi:MAG: LPXTG cell wall anchor domain-containing protein [Acidimicrobiia bacterium]